MRTIVFLNTMKSGSSRDAIKIAEKLGYFTVLLTDQDKLLQQRTEFPDIHRMISVDFSDVAGLKQVIKKQQDQGLTIDAIVSFVDSYVYLAAKLNEEFCNRCFSLEAIKAMEDKILTREVLKDLPFSPYYEKIINKESVFTLPPKINYPYPLMVKSPLTAGSKDVIKVENEDELNKSIKMLNNKYPNLPILIEEYLDGPQYLVETVVMDGNVQIVVVIEQEISQLQRFIITGYSVLNELDYALSQSLQKAVEAIIHTLGMKTGTCHLEMRLIQSKWKLIEINPRISGGAMNHMIEMAYGINLVEETLKISLGLSPNLKRKWEKHIFTQYVVLSTRGVLEKVTGKKRASQFPGVQEVYVKPRIGTLLSPPKSMGQRYAYVIATGDSAEQAKKNAKTAAKEIKFHLKPM
jgi:biotin carboxylase